ncbi:LysE family translocator [Nocardia higoensis]|uniref:LysE family translocator n=1 Tax=Nocardia higoensis TaxID=228599 RepID=UPI000594616A|nr:LysE family translocator [Nocardia higoensis]
MLAMLLSFAVAAVLLVVLPGPDTLVVVRGLVRGGRREGLLTSAGVLCGLLVWIAAAVLGLSALLQASEIGYEALKLVGGCYLIWVGVQSLRSLLTTAPQLTDPVGSPAPSRSGGFGAGFLTDILNPKIGVLFISLLPGFVPDGYPVAWTTFGLGLFYVALTAIYCATLVIASGTIAGWMQTPRIRRRIDGLTGLVLVGFGVRLATEA